MVRRNRQEGMCGMCCPGDDKETEVEVTKVVEVPDLMGVMPVEQSKKKGFLSGLLGGAVDFVSKNVGTIAAVAATAIGGYYAYQKFSSIDDGIEDPADRLRSTKGFNTVGGNSVNQNKDLQHHIKIYQQFMRITKQYGKPKHVSFDFVRYRTRQSLKNAMQGLGYNLDSVSPPVNPHPKNQRPSQVNCDNMPNDLNILYVLNVHQTTEDEWNRWYSSTSKTNQDKLVAGMDAHRIFLNIIPVTNFMWYVKNCIYKSNRYYDESGNLIVPPPSLIGGEEVVKPLGVVSGAVNLGDDSFENYPAYDTSKDLDFSF